MSAAVIHTDTLVIGAGPVGLFQAFQLGLLGLDVQLIDALAQPGGQCIALYPDKPIYDIPGVPVCTGRQLTGQLLAQAAPFLRRDASGQIVNLHLDDQVAQVLADPAGGFDVLTRQGLQLHAQAVFVAAGAGAFVPRTLNVPGLNDLSRTPANLHYHPPTELAPGDDRPPWAGQRVVVAGGADEALSTLVALQNLPPEQRPASLTLLHRRDQFQAEAELDAQVQQLIAQGHITLAQGLPQSATLQGDRIVDLQMLGADQHLHTVPLDHLFVRQGLSPKLGPLTDWGMALERKQVLVCASTFESSVRHLYAVGDINTYPGKKRLLLCGFHEATLAAHAAVASLRPELPTHLQYTTTSAALHRRLGLTS